MYVTCGRSAVDVFPVHLELVLCEFLLPFTRDAWHTHFRAQQNKQIQIFNSNKQQRQLQLLVCYCCPCIEMINLMITCQWIEWDCRWSLVDWSSCPRKPLCLPRDFVSSLRVGVVCVSSSAASPTHCIGHSPLAKISPCCRSAEFQVLSPGIYYTWGDKTIHSLQFFHWIVFMRRMEEKATEKSQSWLLKGVECSEVCGGKDGCRKTFK